MKPVRVAVIGAGYMGCLHLRKLCELARAEPAVRVAGAVEVDPERRLAAGETLGAPAWSHHRELAGRADAAIVAVPTSDHFSVTRDLLVAGVDVLVEKPLATHLGEAEALLALARDRGRVLQVGHLERFNPALQAVRNHIHRPLFVEAHRLGPFPERSTDIDVVRDLMIHDLDLIQRMVGGEPERVEAVGVPVMTDKVDIANARITFPTGCVANVTASRVSPTPMRKLRFFQHDGYFSIDLLDHSVVIFRRVQDGGAEPRIEMERLAFDLEDALETQMRAFVTSVRERKDPVVSGEEGLSALRTAMRVIESMPDIDALR